MVERNLAKVEVESSRLFSRSTFKGKHPRFPLIISARRDSKAVMHRIANPMSPVRLWVAPPNNQCVSMLHISDALEYAGDTLDACFGRFHNSRVWAGTGKCKPQRAAICVIHNILLSNPSMVRSELVCSTVARCSIMGA